MFQEKKIDKNYYTMATKLIDARSVFKYHKRFPNC